jgi:hypothetical protein
VDFHEAVQVHPKAFLERSAHGNRMSSLVPIVVALGVGRDDCSGAAVVGNTAHRTPNFSRRTATATSAALEEYSTLSFLERKQMKTPSQKANSPSVNGSTGFCASR